MRRVQPPSPSPDSKGTLRTGNRAWEAPPWPLRPGMRCRAGPPGDAGEAGRRRAGVSALGVHPTFTPTSPQGLYPPREVKPEQKVGALRLKMLGFRATKQLGLRGSSRGRGCRESTLSSTRPQSHAQPRGDPTGPSEGDQAPHCLEWAPQD